MSHYTVHTHWSVSRTLKLELRSKQLETTLLIIIKSPKIILDDFLASLSEERQGYC